MFQLRPSPPAIHDADFAFAVLASSVPFELQCSVGCAHVRCESVSIDEGIAVGLPIANALTGDYPRHFPLPPVGSKTVGFEFLPAKVTELDLWQGVSCLYIDLQPFPIPGRSRISSFAVGRTDLPLKVTAIQIERSQPPAALAIRGLGLAIPVTKLPIECLPRPLTLEVDLGRIPTTGAVSIKLPLPMTWGALDQRITHPAVCAFRVEISVPLLDHPLPFLPPPSTSSLDIEIHAPDTSGRTFSRFEPIPLDRAAGEARREASRQRPPDDDPFSALFYILLAKKNWDVRVKGLDALLAAYPDDKRPYSFQFEGIQFLASRTNALLADEMGLGKTVQAILALRARVHSGSVQRALIVCPKSLLATWYYEFSMWAPELSVTIAHGQDKWMAMQRNHHVYITNYESVIGLMTGRGPGTRTSRRFDLLIVDEIQNLKNPSTKRSQALRSIDSRVRWGLTGTPLENAFDDYRAVWAVLDPRLSGRTGTDKQFVAATKANVLRRHKNEVLLALPERVIRVEYVELEGRQFENYCRVEASIRRDVETTLRRSKDEEVRMQILAAINKLKQLCVYDEQSGESAKIEWILERIEEMHPDGVPVSDCEKALVFTQYPNKVWDEWRLPQRLHRFNPARYDASLSDRSRQAFPQKFQSDESIRLAFVGIKAGGTGLTLTRANHVIFLDHWWNPADMDQAAARIHRIGQKRGCVVTSLVAKNTIDERILRILDRKRDAFNKLIRDIREGKRDAADIEQLENALTLDDMLEALGLPASTRSASRPVG